MATRKQLEQQYIQDKAFWGSISGRWRGLAGGILLGAVLGAAVGLAAAVGYGAIAGVAFTAMGKGTLLGLVGFFTGSGMLIGSNLWGGGGQIAGAVAAGLMAQKELDGKKAPSLEQEIAPAISDSPPKDPPIINWKVSGLGALIAGATGAFLAYTGALPTGAVNYVILNQIPGSAAAAGAAAITFGTFGSCFGISFKPWRAIKNWTDGLFEGRLSGRTTGEMDNIKFALTKTPEVETQKDPERCYVDLVQQQRVQHSNSNTLAV